MWRGWHEYEYGEWINNLDVNLYLFLIYYSSGFYLTTWVRGNIVAANMEQGLSGPHEQFDRNGLETKASTGCTFLLHSAHAPHRLISGK
jgi:hypothetical protein